MATFEHDRTECRCIDDEVNRRVLWLDPDAPGRVYVYLSAGDVKEAADQFSRYGILEAGELPGLGDERIYAVEFEGKRHDTGEKLGFLKATVEFALARPDLSDAFREYLKSLRL